ncbi:MAG TPA: hypothetical protein VKE96_27995 [Vicinamibacterales bacterium]|nr:hypothetical protein [Vicinamibacterales bacterium]
MSAVQFYDFHSGFTPCAFNTAVTHAVRKRPIGSPISEHQRIIRLPIALRIES